MLTVRDKLLLGLWLLPVALGLVVGLSTGDEDGSVMLFVTGLVAALYVVVLISTVLSARRRRAQPLALPPGSAVTGMLSTGPLTVAGGVLPPGSPPTGTVPAVPGEGGAGERRGGEGGPGEGGPARPDLGPGAGTAPAGGPDGRGRALAVSRALQLVVLVSAAVYVVRAEGGWTFVVVAAQLVTLITMAAYVHERGAEPDPEPVG
ncbi:hypothetical protein QYM41_10695 [Kocuria sp. CPCC 205268]|uniref:hypothetical protein n=1 Tax=Kocuria oxytropis TaxID=3058913 RepID=UPI0034D6746F